jgi:hypothetical protein
MLPIESFLGALICAQTVMQSHEHTDGDQQGALDELARHMRAVQERRDSVTDEALQAALTTITDALTHHWSTGGGTRLRRFIWSLWNDWHLVNLYYLCSGLDYTLGDAVLVVFRAQMVGALTEDHKRAVLEKSGEFARREEARSETPEDEDVLYPPLAFDAEDLSRLARSAAQLAKRLAAEGRAEQARFEAAELEQAAR